MNYSDMFFFRARVYRNDEQYWTVGVKIGANDLEEASRTFLAWSSGVLCNGNCESVKIESVHVSIGESNRGYYWPNEEGLIAEIQHFLGREPKDAS